MELTQIFLLAPTIGCLGLLFAHICVSVMWTLGNVARVGGLVLKMLVRRLTLNGENHHVIFALLSEVVRTSFRGFVGAHDNILVNKQESSLSFLDQSFVRFSHGTHWEIAEHDGMNKRGHGKDVALVNADRLELSREVLVDFAGAQVSLTFERQQTIFMLSLTPLHKLVGTMLEIAFDGASVTIGFTHFVDLGKEVGNILVGPIDVLDPVEPLKHCGMPFFGSAETVGFALESLVDVIGMDLLGLGRIWGHMRIPICDVGVGSEGQNVLLHVHMTSLSLKELLALLFGDLVAPTGGGGFGRRFWARWVAFAPMNEVGLVVIVGLCSFDQLLQVRTFGDGSRCSKVQGIVEMYDRVRLTEFRSKRPS